MSDKNKKNSASNGPRSFEKYWSNNLLKAGYAKGSVFQAPIKVNPKNYTQIFAQHPDRKSDVFIDGTGPFNDRNRALNGDIVAVCLYDQSLWRVNIGKLKELVPDCCVVSSTDDTDLMPKVKDFVDNVAYSPHSRQLMQNVSSKDPVRESVLIRSGRIVAIVQRKHSCRTTGHLHYQNKKVKSAFFVPNDSKVPRIMVPLHKCPKDFVNNPENFVSVLFCVKIDEWSETSQYPKGLIHRILGEEGDIKSETDGILTENNIDNSEFSKEVTECIPQNWVIPEAELTSRRDLRSICVFTIDPITARDLDDAVHCEQIGEGVYEVGVHIADVSYFIEPDTPLDLDAARRATSTYLIQLMVPMLPRQLCENLCSLQPGVDRLTVSVIWKINSKAEIMETWFGRTVIRSCAQLGYDHAQAVIVDPAQKFPNFPPIHNDFTPDQLTHRILTLHQISQTLRKKSIEGGALVLNQPKLQFTINRETGLPISCAIQEMNESHQLIQELMLLANKSVATHILDHFPEKAVLRRHPPPQEQMLENLKMKSEQLGTPLDIVSAGSLQKSLEKWAGKSVEASARMNALVNMCSKPMKHAQYFCSGAISDVTDYHHYALNTPLYTHFTSPIRRYADVLVHRLLLHSLSKSDYPESTESLQTKADHCNDRKNAAKRASEQSTDLYIALMVQEQGSLTEPAVVIDVLDYSFDVYILRLCAVKRIYMQSIDASYIINATLNAPTTITLTWPPRSESDDQETNASDDIEQSQPINNRSRDQKKPTTNLSGDLDQTTISLDSKQETKMSQNQPNIKSHGQKQTMDKSHDQKQTMDKSHDQKQTIDKSHDQKQTMGVSHDHKKQTTNIADDSSHTTNASIEMETNLLSEQTNTNLNEIMEMSLDNKTGTVTIQDEVMEVSRGNETGTSKQNKTSDKPETSQFHEMTYLSHEKRKPQSENREIEQTITTYDIVTVLLRSGDKPLKWTITLVRPDEPNKCDQ